MAFLALEMVGMYLLAQEIGIGGILLWMLAAMVAGVAVIRRAGAGFAPSLLAALQGGHAPFAVVWATGRRFLAGVLLIVPGVISDVLALILLLWPGPKLPPPVGGHRDDGIIEGEYRREEEIVTRIPGGKEP